jgi:flagellar biosynthesis protein FlhB
MAEQQDQDRTEPATPYKRDEARRRGQVAKSPDTNSVVVLCAALAGTALWGKQLLGEGAGLFAQLLGAGYGMSFDLQHVTLWLNGIMGMTAAVLAPFFLLVMAAGIAANMVQTGPIFSFHPLKPDLQRLNPAQGFKRIYSGKALFEALKSVVKLVLLSAVGATVIIGFLPSIVAMTGAHPKGYLLRLLGYAESLAFRLILAILLVALLDLIYVRWDYAKRMRMSRREQREEVKRREGDPHVRAKRRELQREASKRGSSLRRVPDADVLITNPTHLAVALKYERGRSLAPRCIAKGAGESALRMKEMARRSGVIVLERRSLARTLFDEVDLDALIPESLYEPIARLYAEVAAAKRAEAKSRSTLEVRA